MTHMLCTGFTGFGKLRTLLLRDNQLSTWADVDSLNRLPNLADLRLSGNPILNDARGGGRFEVSCSCSWSPSHEHHHTVDLVRLSFLSSFAQSAVACAWIRFDCASLSVQRPHMASLGLPRQLEQQILKLSDKLS